MRHEKKCWPRFFDLILNGEKSFEVRVDEGLYHTGDTLILREYDPIAKEYTGRSIEREIGLVVNTKEQDFWPQGAAFQVMALIDPALAGLLRALPAADIQHYGPDSDEFELWVVALHDKGYGITKLRWLFHDEEELVGLWRASDVRARRMAVAALGGHYKTNDNKGDEV